LQNTSYEMSTSVTMM